MEPLSQRDPRWKDIQLGFSNTTIGTHGCTITSLSFILGTTPDLVNQRLKEVNGYAQGNLVIWSKLPEVFPQIIQATRVRQYDNEIVKDNLPCLVEVNGARIGASRHWVVYVGNSQMMDAWYGNIKSTNYYPPVGYTIIKLKEAPMPDTGNKELEECLRLHSQLVDETVKLKEDKQKLEDTIESLKSNHSKEVDDLKAQVSGSKEEAKQQKDAFKEHKAWEAGALNTTQDVAQIRAEIVRLVTIEDQKNKVDKELGFAVSELSVRNKQVDDLNNTVDRLKEELKIAKGLGDATTAELITEIIKRLTNILRKS